MDRQLHSIGLAKALGLDKQQNDRHLRGDSNKGRLLKRVALVQNQSEMANYSHADCRSLLTKLGYTFELFTANSIGSLDDKLALGQFDCLLLASNALHDKVIRNFFEGEIGKSSVRDFQASSGGVVVLMQYKAAYEGYSFDFVVPDARHPSAQQRPKTESALTSKIASIEKPSSPPLLSYPNHIDLSDLEASSIEHSTLPGVYWHWWEADLSSAWNLHLTSDDASSPRPLLITAQEHYGIRAVMCALPVDWHSHDDLFENIVLYGCEGRHHAAAIQSSNEPEASLQYLIAKLRARKVGLREYIFHEPGFSGIFDNALKGVHNTFLLEPNATLDTLFQKSQVKALSVLVEKGELRTITFEPSSKSWESSVHIRGRKNPAEDAYQALIPRISEELLRGFLDGSFRSTVSGLQDMEYLPYGLDLGIFPVRAALDEAEKHERDGSYDEVIGATAGFLWPRARILGANDPKVRATLKWLRARLAKVDAREKINTLSALHDCGLANADDLSTAEKTLASLTAVDCSELELLAYLTGAVKFRQEQVVLSVLSEFSRRSKAGGGPIWVDTPTTASLVRLLVEAHEQIPSLRGKGSKFGLLLRELLIPSMIHIEAEYERSLTRSRDAGYPWDGKASTALRCLSAWYKFEQYLGAPVEEAASAVARASQEATLSTLADGAIESLRTLYVEYDNLKGSLAETNTELSRVLESESSIIERESRLRRGTRLAIFSMLLSAFLIYVILDHYLRKFVVHQPLKDVGHSLIKYYGQHAAVLAVLLAIFAVPWRDVFLWFGGFFGGNSSVGKSEDSA